jgi:hypothetical protein
MAYFLVEYRGENMPATSTDLLQGTLDLLILQTLSLGPMHGWGVAQRIQQISKEALQIAHDILCPVPVSGMKRTEGTEVVYANDHAGSIPH